MCFICNRVWSTTSNVCKACSGGWYGSMGLGPATIANMKNSITTRCYWFPNISGGSSSTQASTASACNGGAGQMVIIRLVKMLMLILTHGLN
jgi:hypothetical protein